MQDFDLVGAPHAAAVITNLAEEAPLVARMQDALAGEMSRRATVAADDRPLGQCHGISAGTPNGAHLCLPILFIVVDEFPNC